MEQDNPKKHPKPKPHKSKLAQQKKSQPDVKAVLFVIKLPCTNTSAKKQIQK